MSVGPTRKGFTQAKFNDDAVNIIIGEFFLSYLVPQVSIIAVGMFSAVWLLD